MIPKVTIASFNASKVLLIMMILLFVLTNIFVQYEDTHLMYDDYHGVHGDNRLCDDNNRHLYDDTPWGPCKKYVTPKKTIFRPALPPRSLKKQ